MSNLYCHFHGCLSAEEEKVGKCTECEEQKFKTALYTYPPEEEVRERWDRAWDSSLPSLSTTPSSPPLNEGKKADAGKPAFDLIPPHIQLEVAKVLEFGARKYGPENWKMVPGAKRRYIGAAERHINAHRRGELLDPETGLHHISHAIASLMFLGEFFAAGISEVPEKS